MAHSIVEARPANRRHGGRCSGRRGRPRHERDGVVVRRVTLISALTAVLSPVTGVLLLLLGAQPLRIGVLEQLDLLRTFTLYALVYTGPPALLLAALGATVLFALSVQGVARRVLFLAGSTLGAVSGLVVVPPLGHHLLDFVLSGSLTSVGARVGIINGAMWGLVVAGYALRSRRGRVRGPADRGDGDGEVES
jgi:hypothetical protein